MHAQTDLMKYVRYLGVESNFQYQLGVKPLVSVNENFKLGPFPAFVDGAKTLSM